MRKHTEAGIDVSKDVLEVAAHGEGRIWRPRSLRTMRWATGS
jgi:hypothetical protein